MKHFPSECIKKLRRNKSESSYNVCDKTHTVNRFLVRFQYITTYDHYCIIYRSSNSEVFLEKGVWKHATKFIETTLRHGCSAVNLLHIFRTFFLNSTSGFLFLYISEKKILLGKLEVYYHKSIFLIPSR